MLWPLEFGGLGEGDRLFRSSSAIKLEPAGSKRRKRIMTLPSSITIRRPDDWHVHLRDGPMLQACAVHTARQFVRAVIMPNLVPPVTRIAEASAYRDRIRRAVPTDLKFEPLMTCYLTDGADPVELANGKQQGVWVAAKLYPAHATTNSAHGVTSIDKIARGLNAMEKAGMPLLVHGEVTDADVTSSIARRVFETRCCTAAQAHQGMKVVVAHQDKEGVACRANGARMGVHQRTLELQPQRNFKGGIRPHLYACRSPERGEPVAYAPRGELGQSRLPRPIRAAHRRPKECACGCAGIFNAPVACRYTPRASQRRGLDRMEAFATERPALYGS